ncbi:helix-turn-helix domain-containing protein [Neobacillus vireti]|uniref:helix-turn-helix domain-containing protein n=1 Tax=Neobacillus vireti TaxID=220686 RepID=UPI003000855E
MSFESKYNLVEKRKYLNDKENKRLLEIKFYLTFKPIYDLVDNYKGSGYGKSYGDDLFEILALLCEVNTGSVKYPYYALFSRDIRPTKREMVIALRYFGVSYKEIHELYGISHITVMKYVKSYFTNEHESLISRITNEFGIHEQMEEVLDLIPKFFKPMAKICDLFDKIEKRNEE